MSNLTEAVGAAEDADGAEGATGGTKSFDMPNKPIRSLKKEPKDFCVSAGPEWLNFIKIDFFSRQALALATALSRLTRPKDPN